MFHVKHFCQIEAENLTRPHEHSMHISERLCLPVQTTPLEESGFYLPVLTRSFANPVIGPVAVLEAICAWRVRRNSLGEQVGLGAKAVEAFFLLFELSVTSLCARELDDLGLQKCQAAPDVSLARQARDNRLRQKLSTLREFQMTYDLDRLLIDSAALWAGSLVGRPN
jgi:hypothetical protein